MCWMERTSPFTASGAYDGLRMAPTHGIAPAPGAHIGLPELLVFFALVVIIYGFNRLRPR